MVTIGLMGLTFDSSNKGCMALAHSFINILKEVDWENFKYVVFATEKYNPEILAYISDNIDLVHFKFKSVSSLYKVQKKINTCDIVFDFTEGDSFSDIYGTKRMIKVSLMKSMALRANTKLVLGPQTYGPYNSFISKQVARYIFKEAYYTCSRDVQSADLVKSISGVLVDSYTDIAFGLPCVYEEDGVANGKTRIGINISALLWNGGYNGQNQFNLTVNYQEYCRELIKRLVEMDYEVHLIPHVYGDRMPEIENDYIACQRLKEEFPECYIAPCYCNPEEIKGYIANMDFFIGARMHSTIAAFSTNVITIPFSYSKKFEDLYGALGYPYVILARQYSTDKALQETFKYINEKDQLHLAQNKAMLIVATKLDLFKKKIIELLGQV